MGIQGLGVSHKIRCYDSGSKLALNLSLPTQIWYLHYLLGFLRMYVVSFVTRILISLTFVFRCVWLYLWAWDETLHYALEWCACRMAICCQARKQSTQNPAYGILMLIRRKGTQRKKGHEEERFLWLVFALQVGHHISRKGSALASCQNLVLYDIGHQYSPLPLW